MIGTVKLCSLFMKISADRNSFQLAMKANSATVTMPGITSGRKMRTRIWNDIAPGMERAFRDWHDEEHIPERVGVPGFLSGRRFFVPRVILCRPVCRAAGA